METFTLRFSSMGELHEFISITNLQSFSVDNSNATLLATLGEADLQLAVDGFCALVLNGA